jgi:CBS domain-containing protein
MNIATILQKKGHAVVTVKPDATIAEAVDQLHEHRISCLVVSSDGKQIDGLVAARDIAYAMAERGKKLRAESFGDVLDAPITRIMRREVRTCGKQQTLRQVMSEMTRHHVLHMPVVENGELCGIVSNDDVVKYAVEEMDLEKLVLQDSLSMMRTARDTGD